mmetsp:Transcript_27353/g.51087  ORF Transcript_27353/g.51087 Transcript_27353/m.51087 type:complete len:94 (-) Transcript_27353:538-819(-)
MTGVHGAGLGNCILMPPGGLLVELQPLYAFGSDLFMKMAHMSRATYVHVNVKPLFKPQQLITIPAQQLEAMVQVSMWCGVVWCGVVCWCWGLK